MRKTLLMTTILLVAGTAYAFGGGGHSRKATSFQGGADAIGVHMGGKQPKDIKLTCPAHAYWDKGSGCVCDDGYIMKGTSCIQDLCAGQNLTCYEECDSETGEKTPKEAGAVCGTNKTCDGSGNCSCDVGFMPWEDVCVTQCESGLARNNDGTCTVCADENVPYLSYIEEHCGNREEQGLPEFEGSCKSNADCASGEYCNLENQNGDYECHPMEGQCVALGIGEVHEYKGKEYLVSNKYLSWWSAENWCRSNGMELASLEDLGISAELDIGKGYLDASYRYGDNSAALNTWLEVKAAFGDESYFWTRTPLEGDDCVAYRADVMYSAIEGEYRTGSASAICKPTSCGENNNWVLKAGTCVNPCEIGDHPTNTCTLGWSAENGVCVPQYAQAGKACGDNKECDGKGSCKCEEGFVLSGNECIMDTCDAEFLTNGENGCTACTNGNYYMSYMDEPCDTPTNISGCKSNKDCASDEYCKIMRTYGDASNSDWRPDNVSTCRPNKGICTKFEEGTNHKYKKNAFVMSESLMPWWAAENWCRAKGLEMTKLEDLGISWKDNGYHEDGEDWDGLAKVFGSNGWLWMADSHDECRAYYVNTAQRRVGNDRRYATYLDYNRENLQGGHALCNGEPVPVCGDDGNWLMVDGECVDPCTIGEHNVDACILGWVAKDGECVVRRYSKPGKSCGTHKVCAEGGACVCDEGYTGDNCDTCALGYTQEDSQCINPCPEGVKPDANGNCSICKNGNVYLPYMNDPCQYSVAEGNCVSNADCGEGKFCYLRDGDCDHPYRGTCERLDEWGESSFTVEGKQLRRSYGNITWWAAKNWCEAKGMRMISISDLQCYQSGSTEPQHAQPQQNGTLWCCASGQSCSSQSNWYNNSSYSSFTRGIKDYIDQHTYYWLADAYSDGSSYDFYNYQGYIETSCRNEGRVPLCIQD